jgi:serine/threonine-protein phosphatase Stp1
MTDPLRIEDSALTDTGLVRPQNEDSHLSLPWARVWAVADGMGGHENGRFASQTIVEALAGAAYPEAIEPACEAVGDAIHAANRRIFEAASQAGKMMGSTVVAMVVRGDEFCVLWAGDSRAYLLRGDQLIRLTQDHSQVQAMVESGLLTEAQAADHPMRHVLARAVGVQPGLEIDAIRDHLQNGDLFLLCSDGLHGVLSDSEIAGLLRAHGGGAAQPLVAACLERGAPDNVTVVLVAAHEPTLLSPTGEASAS